MARYDLDVRTARLGVKHVQIIEALRARGVKVTSGAYSSYKNGADVTPKADRVMCLADEIVTEMERKNKIKSEVIA